jgi:enolase
MTVEPRKAVQNIQTRIRDGLRALSVSDQAKLDQRLIELDGTSDKEPAGRQCHGGRIAGLRPCGRRGREDPPVEEVRRRQASGPARSPDPDLRRRAHARGRLRRAGLHDHLHRRRAAFAEALEWTSQVYAAAGKRLAKRNALHGVADEGGYWPSFKSNEEGLAELVGAISDAGLEPGADVAIALDIAASQLYRGGSYQLQLENRVLSAEQMHAMLLRWIERYPIVSIEDPFAETDHQAMQAFTRAAGIQVVGDDYFVTDAEKSKRPTAPATPSCSSQTRSAR